MSKEKSKSSELEKLYMAMRNAPEEVHGGKIATAAIAWHEAGFTAEQAKDAWKHDIYDVFEAMGIRDADKPEDLI